MRVPPWKPCPVTHAKVVEEEALCEPDMFTLRVLVSSWWRQTPSLTVSIAQFMCCNAALHIFTDPSKQYSLSYVSITVS
jgi:hypothetical protein